jgi:multiple sugar transport system ATP-binding protein
MSLVPGALERHESGVDFVADGFRLALGTAAEIGLQDGAHPSVLAGFRAEHVTIARGTPGSPLTFGARVELVEPTGSDTFVELDCHGTTVTARIPPDLPVVIGDRVTAEVKPGSVHLFDAGSTLRIVR